MCVGYFNSRLYTRGDVTANLVKKEIPLFQFTPLHERRRNPFASHQAAHPFQFTPLHERRRNQSVWISNDDYFNSRLYTRGDKLLSRHWCICQISIHASTREATATETANAKSQFISIHASTREATISTTTLSLKFLFQFTPLHERRQRNEVMKMRVNQFQFTPLHERQRDTGRQPDLFDYFNSRLYMRGNLWLLHGFFPSFQFQFTPLHERQRRVSI